MISVHFKTIENPLFGLEREPAELQLLMSPPPAGGRGGRSPAAPPPHVVCPGDGGRGGRQQTMEKETKGGRGVEARKRRQGDEGDGEEILRG